MKLPFLLSLLIFAAACSAQSGGKIWRENFDGGSLKNWRLVQPDDWQIAEENGNQYLSLRKEGPVGADPRRPVKFAFFKPACVEDFDLTVRVRREADPGKETDVTLAFAYQHPLRFYYVHLSRDDGNHRVHNGIFRVNHSDRERIAGTGAAPALPEPEWQTIRIRRRIASGEIAVFIGEEDQPRFQVTDRTHGFGFIGLGSFDNKAAFDDFVLAGVRHEGCGSATLESLSTGR